MNQEHDLAKISAQQKSQEMQNDFELKKMELEMKGKTMLFINSNGHV